MFLSRFSFQKTPRKTDHPDPTANDTTMAKYDFDNSIYQAEEGEVVETINIGTEDDKKEIKIGASLQAERKRPLIMYLTVLERSMGCVLGQHDESGRKEHAIYYLSKKFTDCEQRYSLLEKTCRALAWAARRLR
ncbi:hypothetical protein KIW84_013835 [Lathyrus oleraceus]|uniref:Reverse transcriptase RNase H-like domain-containing protein n=1 Tax=Pisum sativum TaxID=3888 RepID=A0A9D5BLD6_PEA|nr:hypothetical protein KIW84_013835 [Pisum sativum]